MVRDGGGEGNGGVWVGWAPCRSQAARERAPASRSPVVSLDKTRRRDRRRWAAGWGQASMARLTRMFWGIGGGESGGGIGGGGVQLLRGGGGGRGWGGGG